jgi:hypothetical protein
MSAVTRGCGEESGRFRAKGQLCHADDIIVSGIDDARPSLRRKDMRLHFEEFAIQTHSKKVASLSWEMHAQLHFWRRARGGQG